MKVKLFFTLWLGMSSTHLFGNDTLELSQAELEEQYMLAYQAYLDSLEGTLNYEVGIITLKDEIATISVPKGFKYLNDEDSEMILVDVWGNPPSEKGYESWGMLIPENESPLGDSSYSVNITFSEEGYIKDDDAASIDYDELLETMQDDSDEINKYRTEQGYPTVDLVGWAAPPFYDHTDKKLHWAKELKFEDSETNTLNYNIRVLGRRGYLQLNAIGEMYVLDEVNQGIKPIVQSVNFTPGNRYEDFDSKYDKIAAYGIGGLIAGKVLAKAGILAKLGLILAKFWKIMAVGAIALAAGFKRFFGKKEEA